LLDPIAQPLAHPSADIAHHARQHERKLLAAVARSDIGRPAVLAHDVGDLTQHLIADHVREVVVDALEVIDVDQSHAKRRLRRRLQQVRNAFQHAAVAEPGERVGMSGQAHRVGLRRQLRGLLIDPRFQRSLCFGRAARELELIARFDDTHSGLTQGPRARSPHRGRPSLSLQCAAQVGPCFLGLRQVFEQARDLVVRGDRLEQLDRRSEEPGGCVVLAALQAHTRAQAGREAAKLGVAARLQLGLQRSQQIARFVGAAEQQQ